MRVKEIVKQSGIKSSNIILEVTEGQAAQDMQQLKHIMAEIRSSGINIAMDDFGTGYSSLSNMRDLPLDIIKIDSSFIQDIQEDAYSQSFVRLITELSHSMGRLVCTEGVETKEQLHYCEKCGADIVQGFYFWHPMPEIKLLELLERERAKKQ